VEQVADLNEPTAIVELTSDSGFLKFFFFFSSYPSLVPLLTFITGTKQKLIRFEMDKEKLAHVLQQINSIQEQLISKVST
jgi:hypothetical protein